MEDRIPWKQGHCPEFMPRPETVEGSREGKWECEGSFT